MWSSALNWLSSTSIQPPQQPRNIWRQLKQRTKHDYYLSLHHVISWIAAASVPFDTDLEPPSQSDAAPFWKLFFLLDSIILHPPSSSEPRSPDRAVQQRLKLLHQGQIESLYTLSNSHTFSPNDAPLTFAANDDPCPEAQNFADMDNFSSASARILSSLPTAKMTPDVIAACHNLYPQRITLESVQRSTRSNTTPLPPVHNNTLLQALALMKPATAAGPFNDYTDTLKGMATFESTINDTETTMPYLQSLADLVTLVAHNDIPPSIRPLLSSCRFIALHKNEQDPSQLRPIGIGTAIRRVSAAYLNTLFRIELTTIMITSGQFGLAIPGGIDYVTHLTQTLVDRFILAPLSRNEPPSRVLLLLDIINMFNSVSRSAVRLTILAHQELHGLLPFFDLMYADSNRCYYRLPDGSTSFFCQEEGFPQGDPMATLLSCLALHSILAPINSSLAQRAALRNKQSNRLSFDDCQGALAQTTSIIDDTSIVIAPIDLKFFLSEFKRLGEPIGIRLKLSKTKLFYSPSSSTDPLIPSEFSTLINNTLPLLSSSSHTDDINILRHGTRFLGQPIGSPDHARSFLANASTAFSEAIFRFTHRITDPQTIGSLFRISASQMLNHLLAMDVLYHTDFAQPPSLGNWDSAFIRQANSDYHQVLSVLSGHPLPLPPHCQLICETPTRDGGLGLHNLAQTAIPAFIIPLLRSIQMATIGISLPPSPLFPSQGQTPRRIAINAFHARPLASWQSTTTPTHLISCFRHYLPALSSFLQQHSGTPPTTRQLIRDTSIRGLQATIYRFNVQALHADTIATLPTSTQHLLPSLLTPLTSIPLHSLPRKHSANRIPPSLYRSLLCRKLRLPLFSTPSTCHGCHKPNAVDVYGDHLLSCRNHKTPLSNRIRDTIALICQELGPLASLTEFAGDTSIETPRLLPEFPSRRPADVSLRLARPTTSNRKILAIDVTVTPTTDIHSALPCTFAPIPSDRPLPFQHQITHVAHRQSIVHKFNGRPSDTASAENVITALNHNFIQLIPFTIDEFGGLGTFAHTFLFSRTNPALPPPPPLPPSLRFAHPAALQAFHLSLKSPIGILSLADSAWKSQHQGSFGRSFHTTTPQQWGLQTLALNFSLALANHIHRATTKLQTTTKHDLSHISTPSRPPRFRRCNPASRAGPTRYRPPRATNGTTH